MVSEMIRNLLEREESPEQEPPREILVKRIKSLIEDSEWHLHSLEVSRPLGGVAKPEIWIREEVNLRHFIGDLKGLLNPGHFR